MTSRVVVSHPVFTNARAPRRAQRHQMRVAAMDAPTQAEEAPAVEELSSEELYARFEEMIAQHDMAHSVGDRVSAASAMRGPEGRRGRRCAGARRCRRRLSWLLVPSSCPAWPCTWA